MSSAIAGHQALPELLDVGQAPYVVIWKRSRPIVYSNGLKLRNRLGDGLEFVETIRVFESSDVIEYQFSADGVFGDWSCSRHKAFQDCVTKANKKLPMHRSVILGPSQEAIQAAIIEAHPDALAASSSDVDADETEPSKHVRWGDETPKVVDEPNRESHRYGGWGLEAFCIIPNRDELKAMRLSWSDMVLDSEDMDEYFVMDDDDSEAMVDREMRSYSLFEDEVSQAPSSTSTKRVIQENEQSLYQPTPIEEAEEEYVEELQTDSSEDTTDEDEESAAMMARAPKRLKVTEDVVAQPNQAESNESFQPPVIKVIQTTPPTCKGDDELRDIDFWLLHNEQIF